MGSVKATYADSTSIGTSPAFVEKGKSVTFTATAKTQLLMPALRLIMRKQ